eukprot:Gb_11475 [translate_table: standard]
MDAADSSLFIFTSKPSSDRYSSEDRFLIHPKFVPLKSPLEFPLRSKCLSSCSLKRPAKYMVTTCIRKSVANSNYFEFYKYEDENTCRYSTSKLIPTEIQIFQMLQLKQSWIDHSTRFI